MIQELINRHPLPWSVHYWQRFPEWNEKSRPWIADANGNRVLDTIQTVGHPGEYDLIADLLAREIVEAVNARASH